jgi:hypothetical protein
MQTKDSLQRFDIIISEEGAQGQHQVVPVLFNIDHIVSVKPIRLNVTGRIIEGYWIRLTNGKKYRAISIPDQMAMKLTGSRKQIMDVKDVLDDSQIELH